MYAVIRSGGKQHRVEPGATLKVEKLDEVIGHKIELDEVLLVASGDGQVTLGDPLVAGARVSATVLDQDRGRKIIVFKKKKKKQYRRTRGHRQDYTEIRVDEIKL
jgi:large subunit ribosomal protein L21